MANSGYFLNPGSTVSVLLNTTPKPSLANPSPVATFQRVLGLPCLLVGVGLPDDQIHAPNERFDLDQYARGVRVIARLWEVMPGALRPI